MKKLPQKLQSDLRELKAIAPDPVWKEQTKQAILRGIAGDASIQISSVSAWKSFFQKSFSRLSLKPLGMIILALGVVVGPGIATVSAARSSLPGDTLYPLKRSLENVELSFTFSEKKKTEKKIDQVATRLTELHRITQEQVPSPEKQQKIVLALVELKKDTDDVKQRLETAKNGSDAGGQDVVDLAKIIEEKTSGYKETLKSSKAQLTGENSTGLEDIDAALSTVQEVAIDALNIIAENHEGEEGQETISNDDLKLKVVNQLSTVKDQVNGLIARVNPAEAPEEAPVNLLDGIEVSEEAVSEDDKQEDTQELDVQDSEEDSVSEPTETEIPPAAELSEFEAGLLKTLNRLLDEEIVYIDELIEMEEFRTALEQLSKTKLIVDQVALDLKNHRESTDLPPTEEAADKAPVDETGEPASNEEQVEEQAPQEETEEQPAEEEVSAESATSKETEELPADG